METESLLPSGRDEPTHPEENIGIVSLFYLTKFLLSNFLPVSAPSHVNKRERTRRKALLFLYLNAALQSFSSAGILAILDLYMSDFLLLSGSTANAITAAFIVVFSAIAPIGK